MAADSKDLDALARALRGLPEMDGAQARDLRRYSNLPYCILAAVFSINSRYAAVRAAVDRYRNYYGLPPLSVQSVEPGTTEPTVSDFISHVDAMGATKFAADVLKNSTRTSPRSGILKSAAARDYAGVLQSHGLERISDVAGFPDVKQLEQDLRHVHGQSSGISTDYFFMNTGDTSRVKPDRWVIAFLERAIGRGVSLTEARTLFVAVTPLLERDYPGITPRALDLAVWESRPKPPSGPAPRGSRRVRLERQILATESRLAKLRVALTKLDGKQTSY